jgi:hypothetical protein
MTMRVVVAHEAYLRRCGCWHIARPPACFTAYENDCAAAYYDVRHDGLNIAGVEPFRYRMSEDRWWAGQDEINGGLVMAAGAQCAWRGWCDPGL